jgi:thioredoxin reductase (NADPH)
MLAAVGEEHTAAIGDVLYRVGDATYPFIAIQEGEVAILDAAGNEIISHGPSSFLGELNLLSGQTVFVTAVVTQPLRYVAVDRDVLRGLLFEDGPLSDLVLATFISRREALQRVEGIGIEIVGPRSSAATMRLIDVARANRLPFAWSDEAPGGGEEPPVVQLPGGGELKHPSGGDLLRALGIGRSSSAGKRPICLLWEPARRPAPPCTAPPRSSASSWRARRSAVRPDRPAESRTTSGSRPDQWRRAHEPSCFPGAEVRCAAGHPYRAVGLEPGDGRHVVQLEEGHEIAARAVLIATGAQYRRLPLADLSDYEGTSVFYAAGPPEAQLCGASRVAVVGGGNSAGQAAVWLARGGALVTLLHRRADLRETMSDYLIRELERYGVAVRDRSEIAELHGRDGHLEAVTLKDGTHLPFKFVFLFLGAKPCTEWLGACLARHTDGFVLTGEAAGASYLLETSIPGIFAAGDVRSGSTKRCAAAVGEGSMAVQFVHEHLSAQPAGVR